MFCPASIEEKTKPLFTYSFVLRPPPLILSFLIVYFPLLFLYTSILFAISRIVCMTRLDLATTIEIQVADHDLATNPSPVTPEARSPIENSPSVILTCPLRLMAVSKLGAADRESLTSVSSSIAVAQSRLALARSLALSLALSLSLSLIKI